MQRFLGRNSRLLAFGGLVAIAFGAFALVYGLLFLGQGLNLVVERRTDWVPYVLGGLVGIAIGAVTFFRPGLTALVLVYYIAAWAIVTGIFEIVAAAELEKGDWMLAVGGVISIAFGILVAARPGSGALAILWLIGIYAIVTGVIRLVAAYRLQSAQRSLGGLLGGLDPRAQS